MNFLFRKPPGSHKFMTTQDPEYVYTVLCGRCGYPVEECDTRCPRCQLELENCPICRDDTHKKAWRVDPDKETGEKTCPVCATRRIPFGGLSLTKVQGSFCRNIYGCRAGGLLLGSNEFAVLRPNASICPICRHEELRPLDVRIFLHLVSRCLYCHTVFGPLPTPTRDDWKSYGPYLEWLGEVIPEYEEHCILCGRRDELKKKSSDKTAGPEDTKVDESEKKALQFPRREEEKKDTVGDDTHDVWVAGTGRLGEIEMKPVRPLHYLRVTELGRVLVLEKETNRAFQRSFDAWFDPLRMASPDEVVPVREVGQYLLDGTVNAAIHRILRMRVEEIQKAWGDRLPSEGLNYRVFAHPGKAPKS